MATKRELPFEKVAKSVFEAVGPVVTDLDAKDGPVVDDNHGILDHSISDA